MATINSATYDAQYGENPRYRLDNSVITAEQRVAEIEYVGKGTEAAGDLINLVQLPIGALIYPEQCSVISEAAGASISKVGDAKVADRYNAAAIALTAAGVTAFTPIPANRIAPWVVDSETKTVVLTVTGAVTAGKKVRVKLVWRLPT